MEKYINTTALIPIRSGSKGLPGKNIRPFAGLPLFMHTVKQAKDVGVPDIVISTDIDQVLGFKFNPYVHLLERPVDLASDNSSMEEVIFHAISTLSLKGTIILLQVTSPLRTNESIVEALKLYKENSYELVMAVTSTDRSILKSGFVSGSKFEPLSKSKHCFTNRQDLPKVYKPNGAIFIFDSAWFLQNKTLASDNIGVICMDEEISLDIDDLKSFLDSERLMLEKLKNETR